MATMRRVNGPIKILDENFKQDGWFSVSDAIPLVLDHPTEVKQGERISPRYYLTAVDNEVVFLHEEAESVVPA